MLRIVKSMCELHFSELMQVYLEGNKENGCERYPMLPSLEQLREAEQDFYQYLNLVFFRQSSSFYAIWETEGHYQAALRLEPYNDGLLLCALETAPDARRCGNATKLILAVQQYLSMHGSGVIYSHVSKKNIASLNVHRKCGFQIIKDHAVYSDGSVLSGSYTLAYTYQKSET